VKFGEATSGAEKMMLLPSVPAAAMAPLMTTLSHERQESDSFRSFADNLKLIQDTNLPTQKYFHQLIDKPSQRDISKYQSRPTQHSPASHQSGDGFAFIQVHDPSGKTDPVGGSSMRSHIRKKFHENRRRREAKDKVNRTSTQVTLRFRQHTYPNKYWNSVDVENSYQNTPKCCEVPTVYEEPPSPIHIRTSHSRRVVPERIKVGTVCVQSKGQRKQAADQAMKPGAFALPQNLLHLNSSDPFDSSAFQLTPKMHGLIQHCMSMYQIT
jgi:hypothetical protein